MKKAIFVLALLFICKFAFSQIWGAGAGSCNDYLSITNKNIFISWTQGFISAFNIFNHDLFKTKSPPDPMGMERFLTNYCSQYPLKDFNEAVQGLLVELGAKKRR